MPIGGYPDFSTCVLDQKKKGESDESAKKICGALEQQARLKGASIYADFTDFKVDADGDIYLKYFLADDSFNVHKWSLNLDKINDALGKPFTKQVPNHLSLKGDGHPWNRLDGAGYNDHLRYANSIKQGEIIDISDLSNNAAIKGANSKQGRYATIKITDPDIAKLYIDQPNLIPKAVSIGIWDHDRKSEPYSRVDNYNVVHLAPVEFGAYGPKATLYATCNGNEQKCVSELKGASNNNNSIDNSQEYSSLGNIEAKNKSLMTVDTSPQETTVQSTTDNAISQTAPVVTDNKTAVTKTTGTGSPIIRLKTQQKQPATTQPANQDSNVVNPAGQTGQSVQQEEQQPQQKDITQTPEFKKLQEEVNELKAQRELAVKKEKIARIIPMQLFIDQKGRFNHEDFGRAVETALNENWSEESIKTFYDMKLDHLNLLNAMNNGTQYIPISEQTAQQPQLQQTPEVPTMGMKGASANQNQNNGYQTNSEVPELKGASNVNSLGISALKGLRSMIAVSRGDNA